MNATKRYFYGYVAVIFSMIFWGVSFVWTKELLNAKLPVFFILLVRLFVSSLILFSFFSLTRKLDRVHRKDFPLFFLLALCEPFLYFLGENFSMKYVDASFASIMIAILPMATSFALRIFNEEKFKWNLIVGVVVSIIGILLMGMNEHFVFSASIEGVLLLVLAVVSGAGYSVVLSRLVYEYGPVTITTYQNIIGTLLFLPCFLFFDMNKVHDIVWSWRIISDLLFLAVLCSSGAFILYSYSAKKLSIAKASVFTNAIPVVTIVFAVLLGQETFTVMKTTGIVIVVSGLIISQIKIKNI